MCDKIMALAFTAQKKYYFVKDFFSKSDQICKFLWIFPVKVQICWRNPSWKTEFFCVVIWTTMIGRFLLLLHNLWKTAGSKLIKTWNGWIQETLLREMFLTKRTKQLQKYLCEILLWKQSSWNRTKACFIFIKYCLKLSEYS